MGNLCSCLKQQKKEYHDSLIRHRYCHQCQKTYISNNEYNKHIVNCNKMYGDM